jgi:hypothetical protein
MKTTNKLILALALIIGLVNVVSAQKNESNDKTRFSVEIDPITFPLNGYGVHLIVQPKTSNHLLIGAGTYAMNIPDLLVGFNPENKDKGWNVRLNQGYGLFGEYHFSEVNKKLFVGTQLAFQQYKIENGNELGTEKFNNFLVMAYLGYTIKPFVNNGLYFEPWAGMGYTTKMSGETKIGNSEYDIAPALMFATLHIGYTF